MSRSIELLYVIRHDELGYLRNYPFVTKWDKKERRRISVFKWIKNKKINDSVRLFTTNQLKVCLEILKNEPYEFVSKLQVIRIMREVNVIRTYTPLKSKKNGRVFDMIAHTLFK